MNVEKIYKTKTICTNCFKTAEMEVPYGKEAYKYLIDKECSTCGCKAVVQIKPNFEQD